MPVMAEVFADEVVEVLTTILALPVTAPMVLPSAGLIPPIFIPAPLVSIPVNTGEPAAEGTEETEIPAIVLPLIFDSGEALPVLNKIPWYETLPSVDE